LDHLSRANDAFGGRGSGTSQAEKFVKAGVPKDKEHGTEGLRRSARQVTAERDAVVRKLTSGKR
jgi:hypothetical protein